MSADIWMILEGNRITEEEFKEKLALKMNAEYEEITGTIPDFRLMKSLSEVAFKEFAWLI